MASSTHMDDLRSQAAFAWFTGIVEDIMDPEELGRVRVRCIGYHSDNRQDLPVEALPWALVVLPVTSSSMARIGLSATGIQQGSWVVGFFRDGPSAQDPMILGTIPSYSTVPADFTKGFTDPAGINPGTYGPDIPWEATKDFASSTSYSTKVEQRRVGTPTANGGPDWDQPDPASYIGPVYPRNQVLTSMAGHVLEVDSTTGKERLSEFTPSGTFREVDQAGNLITRIVGKRYTVVVQDDNVYVKGHCNLTVDGDVRTLVAGDYHLEVLGNYTQVVGGNSTHHVGANSTTTIGGSRATEVSGSETIEAASVQIQASSGTIGVTASGAITINGSVINLN